MTTSLHPYSLIVFDTDGVLTDTAVVHAAAWKELFDEYLARRGEREGRHHEPFDAVGEYLALVDGKPRYDGVRSFLAARGIELPGGAPDDEPGTETVCGLGNAKDAHFQERLARDGVDAFPDAVRLLDRLDAAERPAVAVSASRNARDVLGVAGVRERFAAIVDGVESDRLGLAGKPDPALFLVAADRMGVDPERAVVVEDAVAGVEAGRRGGFGLVVGLDRVGQAAALRDAGAHVVVGDLDELVLDPNGGRP
ncbi:MAG: HAD-IA family hydrolase [Microthrixaceae bacterium]|nr:HAD-IA family hydrolase [Microthrixaceae bacterium]